VSARNYISVLGDI